MFKFAAFAVACTTALAAEAEQWRDVTFQINFGTGEGDSDSGSASASSSSGSEGAACSCSDLAQTGAEDGHLRLDCSTSCEDPAIEVLPVRIDAKPEVDQVGFFMSPSESEPPCVDEDEIPETTARNPGLISDWDCSTAGCGNIDCSPAIEDLLAIITQGTEDMIARKTAQTVKISNAWVRLGKPEGTIALFNTEIDNAYTAAIAVGQDFWPDAVYEFIDDVYELPTIADQCLTEVDPLVEMVEALNTEARENERVDSYAAEYISTEQLSLLRSRLTDLKTDITEEEEAEIATLLAEKLVTSGWSITQEEFNTKTREYYDKYIYYGKITLKEKIDEGDLSLICPEANNNFQLEDVVQQIKDEIKKIQDLQTYKFFI